MKLYHETHGDPNREQILRVAALVGLKDVQVYKWIWDQKQRQDKNTAEILQCAYPLERQINLEHKDGEGNFLSPVEV